MTGLEFSACTVVCCLLKQQQDLQHLCVIRGLRGHNLECCCQLHTNLLVSWSITSCHNLHFEAKRAKKHG